MPKTEEIRTSRLQRYRGKNNKWYWRLRAGNGQILACGGQGFARRRDVERTWRRVAAGFHAALSE